MLSERGQVPEYRQCDLSYHVQCKDTHDDRSGERDSFGEGGFGGAGIGGVFWGACHFPFLNLGGTLVGVTFIELYP